MKSECKMGTEKGASTGCQPKLELRKGTSPSEAVDMLIPYGGNFAF
jgi:hypothetical protein